MSPDEQIVWRLERAIGRRAKRAVLKADGMRFQGPVAPLGPDLDHLAGDRLARTCFHPAGEVARGLEPDRDCPALDLAAGPIVEREVLRADRGGRDTYTLQLVPGTG